MCANFGLIMKHKNNLCFTSKAFSCCSLNAGINRATKMDSMVNVLYQLTDSTHIVSLAKSSQPEIIVWFGLHTLKGPTLNFFFFLTDLKCENVQEPESGLMISKSLHI